METYEQKLEKVARAMYDAVAKREGHWQRWDDADDDDQVFVRSNARAALAAPGVTAPAIIGKTQDEVFRAEGEEA